MAVGGASGEPGAHEVTTADVARRLDQLATRVEALAGLVESLHDRRSAPREPNPLTSHELADIAARMVRLIEVRLDTHAERLNQVITELVEPRSPVASSSFTEDADLGSVGHNLALLGRAVVDVQRSVDHVRDSLPDVNELAIMAHVDRWFEETNARLASDVEQVRRDLHRFDQAVAELRELVGRLPDRSALDEVLQSRPPRPDDHAIEELRQLVAEMPRHIALQDPVARLDNAIIGRIDERVAEMARDLAQKMEDQLAARVQRFEALSQSMIALAGEPIDRLTDKLNALAAEREPTLAAARTIEQLQSAIGALRQEGLEREALLRHVMDTKGPAPS